MSLVKSKGHVVPTIFDEFFKPDWFGGMDNYRGQNVPAVNVLEDDKGFNLEVVAPGFKKEDFSVEVDQDVLTITAEKQEEESNANAKYNRKEYIFRSFKRSFTLPETVDGNEINAQYDAGLLKLTIPKKEVEIKQKRIVEIA